MSELPLVSIISVNYDQPEVTCELLSSLREVTYPNIEIIIVDNASPSTNPDTIKERFPEVVLIKSEFNLGFAGGNNLGIMQAKGEYLLFLNNDTEVEPQVIEPLVEAFKLNEKAGIASPKIIYYFSENLIQYAGSKGINPWTGRSITIGSFEEDKGQHDCSSVTQLVDGAAMMVPMKVIKKVGMMPEIYFLYYEELDWCEMIKRAGYTCHYVSNSKVFHKESVSVGKESVMKTYYMNKNRLLFIRRNIRSWQFITSSGVFLFAAIPKKIIEYSIKLKGKHLQALFKGLFWNLCHLKVDEINHYVPRNKSTIKVS